MNNRISTLTSDEVLKKLVYGNKRFVELKQIHPDQTPDRRYELRDGPTSLCRHFGLCGLPGAAGSDF